MSCCPSSLNIIRAPSSPLNDKTHSMIIFKTKQSYDHPQNPKLTVKPLAITCRRGGSGIGNGVGTRSEPREEHEYTGGGVRYVCIYGTEEQSRMRINVARPSPFLDSQRKGCSWRAHPPARPNFVHRVCDRRRPCSAPCHLGLLQTRSHRATGALCLASCYRTPHAYTIDVRPHLLTMRKIALQHL